MPGLIQAEDFDEGGKNFAYVDDSRGNSGGYYRSTDVDIQGIQDSGPGYALGWTKGGEWVNYTIDVPAAGVYALSLRAASPTLGGKFHVDFGGVDATGSLTIPNTGSWDVYQTVSVNVSLKAGQQVMRLAFDSVGGTGWAGNVNWIRIDQGPTVSAGAARSGAEGSAIAFAGSVVGGTAPYTYSWTFGDGGSASGSLTPSYRYADNGTFSAILTVRDAAGRAASSWVPVTVANVAPTATIGGSTGGAVGAALGFTASATDPGVADTAAGFTYVWNFGDGTTGLGATTTHAYAAPGTYTVTVAARDKDGGVGAAASRIVQVTASSGLIVSAGPDVVTTEGGTVDFAPVVSGGTGPYQYRWDFGDGAAATSSAGFVGSDATTKGSWMGVYGGAGHNVVGAGVGLPSYAQVGATGNGTYTFASSTTDARALQKPANPADRIAAAWNSTTTFVVDVKLTDGDVHPVDLYFLDFWREGRSQQVEVVNAATGAVLDTRTVSDFSQGVHLTWNVGGHVQFRITRLAGPSAVLNGLFIGQGLNVGSGSSTPSHRYEDSGAYTATLTVTDAQGRSATARRAVTVLDVAPTVSLSAPTSAGPGTAVPFSASATDPSPLDRAAGFTYNWRFGDGATGTGASPTHVYASPGTYTVSVTATSWDGVVSQAATSVLQVSGMSVSAGASGGVAEGSAWTFVGSAAGGTAPYSYFWNFGDGATASGTLSPSHVYQSDGEYAATLTVVDASGQVGVSTARISVADVASTVAIAAPPVAPVNTAVQFLGSVADPSPTEWFAGYTYSWNFGDGSTGVGEAPSHVYSSPGNYTVTVRATSSEGATTMLATTTLAISLATVIPIDAAWLSRQGAGPYILNQAGAVYSLMTDVTTSGTAFVVLNKDVTLDLNGHTVTYGNSQPIVVANGGFEQGSGASVPGWNLSQAPRAAVAANSNYLFGSQVLRLSNFSTPQTIVSQPMTIATPNRTYTATITPAGVNSNSTVQLLVLDAATNQVLGSATSANVQRGFSAVVHFVPATAGQVVLKVVVTPAAGQTDSLDLDEATLTTSFDYGVVASRAWSGDAGLGYRNLGAAVQAVWDANRMKVTNFRLVNGSVVQGQGAGFASSPIFAAYSSGIAIDRVQTSDVGVDTTSINLENSSGPRMTITNSTIRQGANNVTNRMAGPAAISLIRTSGAILIQGNKILGSPQTGVKIDTSNGPIVIDGNRISQNALVADASAIGLVSASNFRVTNNQIDPIAGEGIAIDGFRAQASSFGVIRNNTVLTQEPPNRETGLRTYARALRIRNDVDMQGAHRNIDVSGNTFVTTVGPGASLYGYTVWVGYANNGGAMNDANVSIHDNLIKALVTTADPAYSAAALVVDGLGAGINMKISNNVLESNDTSLAVGGYNAADVSDLDLISNTLRKSASGASRPYTGIRAGYYTARLSNVRILDTRLENGATSTISWSGQGVKQVQVGSLLTLDVRFADGTAAGGANVQVFDQRGALAYSGTADSRGMLAAIPIAFVDYQQKTSDSSLITNASFGPFTVKASSGTKRGSAAVSLTGAQSLRIVVQ
ncbi:PKD domain-containing protein [Paludisphaera soli]|uniref:PKD domain-containing protein n=1 Tax=Paludisphaera soli TaxID=2712865 RepID=UPI0013EA28BC|nr:PKD domain-containing protein [Paludisphaera soli]